MNGSGITASDVLALTKDNDGFGGVGLIILLFIFLMAISNGNGFFGGGNGNQQAVINGAAITIYKTINNPNNNKYSPNNDILNTS